MPSAAFKQRVTESCVAEKEKQEEVYAPAESSGTQPLCFGVDFEHKERRPAASSEMYMGSYRASCLEFHNYK